MKRTTLTSIGICLALQLMGSAAAASKAVEAQEPDKLRIVCTLGILGDLAQQVGGEHVSIEVLSSPHQDPHFVEPRPTLMRKAREADLFLEVGLKLELWAGKVVAGSGNARIQLGQPGHLLVSQGIPTLELPSVLSRELGDVHPDGNPHLWLDPVLAARMAANIERALSSLDAVHRSDYQANLKRFEERIDRALFGEALLAKFGSGQLTRMARSGKLIEYLELRQAEHLLGGWLGRARPLRGQSMVTYHKTFVYFAERFGMQIPIEVEAKPGSPPTPKHKAAVLKLMQEQGIKALLQEVFFEREASESLCAATGARLCLVPIDVGPDSAAKDFFELMDLLIDELLLAQESGQAQED